MVAINKEVVEARSHIQAAVMHLSALLEFKKNKDSLWTYNQLSKIVSLKKQMFDLLDELDS